MTTPRALLLGSLLLGVAAVSGAQTLTKVTAAAPQGWNFWNFSFASNQSSTGLTVLGPAYRDGAAPRGALWLMTGSFSPSQSDGGGYFTPTGARKLSDLINFGFSFTVSSGSAVSDSFSRFYAPFLVINLDRNADGATDDGLMFFPDDNGWTGAAGDLNRFIPVDAFSGNWRLRSELNAGKGRPQTLAVWRTTLGATRITNLAVALGGGGSSNANKIGGVDNVIIGFRNEAARNYDFE